ncbi:OmpH family outer membrane protein [Treponema sp. OMZ 840]|uniref:OmpH family outer membrane protein n=1 Tax=Treponema sp. OMZ 840 TaxID=244313 RepID=UPI003D8AD839
MNTKKTGICIVLLSLYACVFAQQITNVGVVDIGRVYTTYFRESSAVRNYDTKKAEFQAEIDKRTAELKSLQDKKVEYEKARNETAVLRIESEINKKTEYLEAYASSKNMELEKLRKNLSTSNSFYQQLYKVIRHIAESEGYTIILSLQQANAVLWYSPTVDITEKVIAELGNQ